jgi:hypothetical protein
MRRAVIPVALLLAGLACGESTSPDSGCTSRDDGSMDLNTFASLFNGIQPSLSTVSNGRRSAVWYAPTLIDLCVAAPEGGNTATFGVTFVGTTPADMTASGTATTSVIFQPYSVELGRYANGFQGELDDIGLVQASSDGKHATVVLALRLNFPTKGSDAADIAYLQSLVSALSISWTFQKLEP